jgi:hypothetical protein
MNARSVVLWGFALAAAPLIPACTTESPGALNPMEPSDGAAPDGASGGNDDSGGAISSGDSSKRGDAPTVTDDDSGRAQDDSGSADGSHARDSGECIRPPYQTTNACTGIGTPGGPVIPSCSRFNGSGQLICPTIPGCTVVPDPSGTYCTGDNVNCGLSDCGHICLLPNWEPCFDVASGKCLEGC